MGDVEKYCPEALWHLARPLLPEHPKRHQGGGRRQISDRVALAAILHVLNSGCAWNERRGIKARIARKGIESSTRLGRHRYVIERCLEWVTRFRRLARRYERPHLPGQLL